MHEKRQQIYITKHVQPCKTNYNQMAKKMFHNILVKNDSYVNNEIKLIKKSHLHTILEVCTIIFQEIWFCNVLKF